MLKDSKVRGAKMDGLTPELIEKVERTRVRLQLSSKRKALRWLVENAPEAPTQKGQA